MLNSDVKFQDLIIFGTGLVVLVFLVGVNIFSVIIMIYETDVQRCACNDVLWIKVIFYGAVNNDISILDM